MSQVEGTEKYNKRYRQTETGDGKKRSQFWDELIKQESWGWKEGGDLMVQLTAGDYPADLGAGNLEEDSEGCDPGIGVQHRVQRPHQETCRDDTTQRRRLGLKLSKQIPETELRQRWYYIFRLYVLLLFIGCVQTHRPGNCPLLYVCGVCSTVSSENY